MFMRHSYICSLPTATTVKRNWFSKSTSQHMSFISQQWSEACLRTCPQIVTFIVSTWQSTTTFCVAAINLMSRDAYPVFQRAFSPTKLHIPSTRQWFTMDLRMIRTMDMRTPRGWSTFRTERTMINTEGSTQVLFLRIFMGHTIIFTCKIVTSFRD